MKRTIIKINEKLCNGCGVCVKGCHEGALQLINGKAVIISDLYCDGLGACIGECPTEAIILEEREAVPYNEEAVMERMILKGEKVVHAHLNHLNRHGESKLLQQGLDYLKKHAPGFNFQFHTKMPTNQTPSQPAFSMVGNSSELRQFPVQLHLLNPQAGFMKEADLLLAADCTAFAHGSFHNRFLKNKSLAIACPKLDSNIQKYVDKLTQMIDVAKINTLTVIIMEVPCCSGLIKIAQMAMQKAERKVPLKVIVLSVQGEVVKEEWK